MIDRAALRRARLVGCAAGVAIVLAIALLTRASADMLTVHRLRAGVALLAFAAWRFERRRALREGAARGAGEKRCSPVSPRVAAGVAAALAVLAVGAYARFGNLGRQDVFHRHDFFHYYVGAKYAPELGYTRIYACTAVAQAELGQRDEVIGRRIRNLVTEQLEPGAIVLARRDACRPRFTEERWRTFVGDVRFFRSQTERAEWDAIQSDHGYNPPPLWTATGRLITSLRPASTGFILALASLDVVLLASMFAAIGWAFGARVLCVALVFHGCQDAASSEWVNGTFMRQDWLFCLVVGTCLLAKRRHAAGGFVLAAACLLRIFPAVLLAGPAVVIALHAWRAKRLASSHRRFLAGLAIGAAVLTAYGVMVSGAGAYRDFAEHIRVHASVPAANQMGVPTLLMHDLDGSQDRSVINNLMDPFTPWRDARISRLRALRPVHVLAVVAIGAVVARIAARRRALWIALAVSVPLAFAALQLACYYWALFVLLPLLTRVERRIEGAVCLTVGLAEVAATMPALSSIPNDEYATQSLFYLALCVVVLAVLYPRRVSRSSPAPHSS